MEIGSSLGHYEIRESLGVGGMGEVYLGWDERLRRKVAIKVIREGRAMQPDDRARFEREARLLASLNHSNIAGVHGFEEHEGTSFLILELIEGDTLEQRLRQGSLRLEDALRVAFQVSKALNAAHRAGIIHRDLKPANIKITPENDVKVLDFGLAKSVQQLATPVEGSIATRKGDEALTAPNVVIGTAPYMSPEQHKGDRVDKRADIWAFGCILYEVLTGSRPFQGNSMAETISSILLREPDWEALPDDLPLTVRHILQRCLQKDVRRRLQDIADARIELADAIRYPGDDSGIVPGLGSGPMPKTSQPPSRWRLLPWAVAAAALAMALWGWSRPASRPVGESTVFSVDLPAAMSFETTPRSNPGPNVAISRDGTRIVFVARRPGGPTRLMLRDGDVLEPVEIPATEGAELPFFSPDGESVGYFANERLMRVRLGSGRPQEITEATSGYGGAWGLDNTIIYTPTDGAGLWRVSVDGGSGEPITVLGDGEMEHDFPIMTPDGKSVLFSIWTGDVFQVALLDLETETYEVLLEDRALAHYLPSGYLIYADADSIYARRYDLGERSFTDDDETQIFGVVTDRFGLLPHFAVSHNGALVYAEGGSPISNRRLVWVDRDGGEEEVGDRRAAFADPRLSPSGDRVALTINGRIQVLDLSRDTLTHVTTEGNSAVPQWSPDGQWIGFSASFGGARNLYRVRSDGGEQPEALLPAGNERFLDSWSGDGRFLAYTELRPETTDDDILAIEWAALDRDPIEVAVGPRSETRGSFSPGGDWVAYTSNESGTVEVYVRPFQTEGSKTMISVGGGTEPLWGPAGDEIFYRLGEQMMAVRLEGRPDENPGEPEPLFRGAYLTASPRNYDVAKDGRFLMVKTAEGPTPRMRFIVVRDWTVDLDRGPQALSRDN